MTAYFRAYLALLHAHRTGALPSLREEWPMRSLFVGGPLDGSEKPARKDPPPELFPRSVLLVGPDGAPLLARYELVRIDFPSRLATYQFRGWKASQTA